EARVIHHRRGGRSDEDVGRRIRKAGVHIPHLLGYRRQLHGGQRIQLVSGSAAESRGSDWRGWWYRSERDVRLALGVDAIATRSAKRAVTAHCRLSAMQ